MKSKFAKNVAVLMTGTAVAQALTIIVAPILSRLYDPSAFGIFALYSSMISVIATIASLRYELAIVLPKKDDEATNLLAISFFITFGLSALTTVFIFFAGDRISTLLGTPELEPWLWWVPVGVFATGLFNALNYWSTRRKSFKRLSISQILRSVGVTGTQITGGLLTSGATGLIGGQVAGQSIASFTLGWQVWRDDKNIIKRGIKLPELKRLVKEHYKFPVYSAPQTLLNSVSQNVPPFLLAFYFGSYVVGLYALAVRLLQLPINLISQSVRQVFFQKATEVYNENGNLYRLLVNATLGLAGIAFLPTVLLLLIAPWLFSVVLGEEWYEAGVYAKWLVLWLFFAFANRPANVMTHIFGLQNYLLAYEIVLLVLRTLSLVIGGIYSDVILSIICYSIVGAVLNLLLIISVVLYVGKKEKQKRKEGIGK